MTASTHPDLLLDVSDVEVRYDGVIVALRGVTLQVPRGTIVALLGANGAGKSTTLKAISGLLQAERGERVGGRITFDGTDIASLPPHRWVARGLSQVLEGRRCFAHLTVEENLRVGGFVNRPSRAALAQALEQVYSRFPRLKLCRHRAAGYTSGGEQQMVAIGRALMAKPRLVLLDEPSMGLAPLVVQEIFEGLRALNQQDGVSFLLAEQNAVIALNHAHHAFVLENGRVAVSGPAAELRARDDMQNFYLGGRQGERRPFIDAHQVRGFTAATA